MSKKSNTKNSAMAMSLTVKPTVNDGKTAETPDTGQLAALCNAPSACRANSNL